MAQWRVTTATSDDLVIGETVEADTLDQHGETVVLWKDSERVAVVSQRALVSIMRLPDPPEETAPPPAGRTKAAKKKGRG